MTARPADCGKEFCAKYNDFARDANVAVGDADPTPAMGDSDQTHDLTPAIGDSDLDPTPAMGDSDLTHDLTLAMGDSDRDLPPPWGTQIEADPTPAVGDSDPDCHPRLWGTQHIPSPWGLHCRCITKLVS